jgi:hypothetical protein
MPQGTDTATRRLLGKALQAFYDELVREPVPERWTDLLHRLNEQERVDGQGKVRHKQQTPQ